MLCKKSLIVIGVALTLLCGTSVAMDHSQAGSSVVGASSTLADNSEKWVVVTCSNNETFTLNFDKIKELPLFKNRDYLNEALTRGVSLPFELATGTGEVFKTLLAVENSEDVNRLLYEQPIQRLISLVWLFEFFCDRQRADQVAQFLESKDFLRAYMGEQIPLPKLRRDRLQSFVLSKLNLCATQSLQILRGHTGRVSCMTLTPDCRLITGSADHTIRVWNLQTGRCLRTLTGHTDSIFCMELTTNGRLITSSCDNTIRVWNVQTGECLRTLKSYTHRMMLTSGGRLIICSEHDHTIRVWDVQTGVHQTLKDLYYDYRLNRAMILTPDDRLIIGFCDGTIRVWDVQTGVCLQKLTGRWGQVECMALTPDGRLISGSDDRTIRVWDLQTGECLKILTGHTSWVNDLILTPDGRLISNSGDLTIRIWNIQTGECLKTLTGHTKVVRCMTLTPDGRLISSSDDRTIRGWDLQTGECMRILAHDTFGDWHIPLTPDGRVLITHSDNHTIHVRDVQTDEHQTLPGRTDVGYFMKLTPDGRAITKFDHTVRVLGSSILEIHALSVEQLLLVSKITNQCVDAAQACAQCMRELYRSLPEATRCAIAIRASEVAHTLAARRGCNVM